MAACGSSASSIGRTGLLAVLAKGSYVGTLPVLYLRTPDALMMALFVAAFLKTRP
jgi:hypothetical protein